MISTLDAFLACLAGFLAVAGYFIGRWHGFNLALEYWQEFLGQQKEAKK